MKTNINGVPDKIWKDKRIKPEGKLIYAYIYSKGSERIITNINVGEIQQVVKMKNPGLKNNLQRLEKFKYIVYKEYSQGMYTISLLNC